MAIDFDILKALRERTGVGIAECKIALEEAHGELENAVKFLRKRGQLKAGVKTARAAHEGRIACYLHANGRIGAMVELHCETDFVSRSDDFQSLAKDIALQVVSENPLYLSKEEIPSEVFRGEQEIIREQLTREGKSPEMIEKILVGKLKKYYQEVCLLEQIYIKDDKKCVRDLISDAVLKLGENIQITRFMRFAL